MLTFTCNYCKNEYPVTSSPMMSVLAFSLVYAQGNKRIPYTGDDKPCIECEVASEEAKKEALEARKKKI